MNAPRPDAGDRSAPPSLPAALRTTAGWSARLLLIGAAAYVLSRLATALGPVVLSLFGGLLLTALLRPVAARLGRWGLPRLVASWLARYCAASHSSRSSTASASASRSC